MNEIESIIEELYTKKVHINGYFGIGILWRIKSHDKILRKLLADNNLCDRFHWLLFEID